MIWVYSALSILVASYVIIVAPRLNGREIVLRPARQWAVVGVYCLVTIFVTPWSDTGGPAVVIGALGIATGCVRSFLSAVRYERGTGKVVQILTGRYIATLGAIILVKPLAEIVLFFGALHIDEHALAAYSTIFTTCALLTNCVLIRLRIARQRALIGPLSWNAVDTH